MTCGHASTPSSAAGARGAPLRYRVVRVPALDTGIGRAAGFANDQELVEHVKAEREKLPPSVRDLYERLDAAEDRAFLHGTGGTSG
jgi:hypothetical protein